MSDTAEATESESDRRQREACEQLLAREPVTTRGTVSLASGGRLEYGVKASFVPVTKGGVGSDRDDLHAAVFTVAYQVPTPEGAPRRPVCFAFNGGPGSPAIWLHLGALGPKRVVVDDDGTAPPPPYRVEDNPLTWLEHFDLVFVDPPHTGYSITASDAARTEVLSVDGDVRALAEVMRGWLAANGRFGSPLYYAGESYGTTRGAALADAMESLGLGFTGVILVSCAMDIQGLVFATHNDLPYALYLPAFAGVAQYHGRLSGDLAASPEAAREAADAFVAEEYLAALHSGARVDDAVRDRVARRISELTGLPEALVRERNLRIDDTTFFLEALRDTGRVIGRLEARVASPGRAIRRETIDFDAGIAGIMAPYVTAGLAYFAELGIPGDARYNVLSPDVAKSWKWLRGSGEGMWEASGFATTSDDLAQAMRKNPHLRVFVASGYYDLGTPYSVTDWSLAQLNAPREVLTRITHRYYGAGHMFYTREADLRALKDDLATWLAEIP
jgi:carboxypeptidase C (cathepsin A)